MAVCHSRSRYLQSRGRNLWNMETEKESLRWITLNGKVKCQRRRKSNPRLFQVSKQEGVDAWKEEKPFTPKSTLYWGFTSLLHFQHVKPRKRKKTRFLKRVSFKLLTISRYICLQRVCADFAVGPSPPLGRPSLCSVWDSAVCSDDNQPLAPLLCNPDWSLLKKTNRKIDISLGGKWGSKSDYSTVCVCVKPHENIAEAWHPTDNHRDLCFFTSGEKSNERKKEKTQRLQQQQSHTGVTDERDAVRRACTFGLGRRSAHPELWYAYSFQLLSCEQRE